MHFSLENRTIDLSVGEFAGFSLGPQESGGGPQGLWRAQLGQHWHNELQRRTEKEFSTDGALHPGVRFEVPIEGCLVHRGWTFALNGRIDQMLPESPLKPNDSAVSGLVLREIKSVLRPLPADESALRADYPDYFLQIALYAVLQRALGTKSLRAELVFVEADSGLAQTIVLTPFDEALVFHQLDAVVEFLNLRLRAAERRRHLQFRPPFTALRSGQETIQQDLAAAFRPSEISNLKSQILLFEAPTGYGKTGCVLEFALGQLKVGRFARLVWLTGKSTGQIQVVHTLKQMTTPEVCHIMYDKPQQGTSRNAIDTKESPAGKDQPVCHTLCDKPSGDCLPVWQVRNKGEHCINHTFHCVRDGCDFLRDCAERWPGSGLTRFYTDERQPHDLDSLRAAGQEARICPYEITRAALPFNDVWIGDFNYVFAPDNRGLFFERPGFNPAETLLVVDEAHNLPSRVAGAYSHTATESDARLLLAELDHLLAPPTLSLAVEEWIRLLASLQPAESLDPDVEAEIHSLLERLARLATTTQLDYVALGPKHSETLWQFPALAGFLADEQLVKQLWVPRPGQLEFTCVDAAAAIGETLRQFGGAILMSATLQPYAEFAEGCGLEVEPALRAGSARAERGLSIRRAQDPELVAGHPYGTLHAPTPWRAGAYDVAVDLRVDTTFRQRANHYATTAATIVAMQEAASSQVSGPRFQVSASRCVAVFFPSYAYAEAIEKTLRDYNSVLRIALQPKLPDLAAQTAWVEENLALSDALFLVLGSSFAEGIDLLGGRITHAIVVGPALPEVNAVQKARMSALSELGRDAAFRRVYQIPGLQKVNQALGRLVRAPGQKAKVLLHCRRFAEPSYASLLATDYQMYSELSSESDLAGWLTR